MGDRSLDDDDYQYGRQQDDDDGFGEQAAQLVQNQPHDEEVALSDEDVSTGGRDMDASLIESQDMDEAPAPPPLRSTSPNSYTKPAAQGMAPAPLASQPSEAMFPAPSGATQADDGDIPGGYNAQEFKHLNVSDEIRELFKYIGRYSPHTIELDTVFKPFIPDYIPCVGGIDEFLKVPRPDGKPDFLGLKVLDEPAARQTDPTVLTLQLRQHTKEAAGSKADTVGRVEHGDENKVKKITQWVSSINDIHKSKPPANVTYSRRMPDIETLMQEWPPELEAFLKNMKMPSGEMDLDLVAYTKLICGLMDVPVYDNPIESLHVLFSLYLEFKSNPIFQQQLAMDAPYNTTGQLSASLGREGSGRLVPAQWGGEGGGGVQTQGRGPM